jgi:hypothetical protein
MKGKDRLKALSVDTVIILKYDLDSCCRDWWWVVVDRYLD